MKLKISERICKFKLMKVNVIISEKNWLIYIENKLANKIELAKL